MLKKGTKQKNKRYKETENSVAGSRTRFICTFKQLLHLCTTMTACSAGVSQGVQFARESAMLKLSEERRKWGESKGAGRGRGERRENGVFFFSPLPLPPFLLSPSHLPQRLLFLLSPIFHCHKIKDGGYNNFEYEQGFSHPKYAALQATMTHMICKLILSLSKQLFSAIDAV